MYKIYMYHVHVHKPGMGIVKSASDLAGKIELINTSH